MREVIVGVIGGKRRRLERERNCNQEQYRKRPYIEAMKLHTLLNYTVIHATRAEGIAWGHYRDAGTNAGMAASKGRSTFLFRCYSLL